MNIIAFFAHPDDETFCAGGAFAKYVDAGAEVMVVSITQGEAGQIRDAHVATRRTLGQIRARKLSQYFLCFPLSATAPHTYGEPWVKAKAPPPGQPL